jgi:hypothetical protein
MIQISSKREGFRRCGVAHPRGPVIYDNDRFSQEELEILGNEPMLVVVAAEGEAAAMSPDFDKMDDDELKALLTKLEIPIPAKATKPKMIKLLKKHAAVPAEA